MLLSLFVLWLAGTMVIFMWSLSDIIELRSKKEMCEIVFNVVSWPIMIPVLLCIGLWSCVRWWWILPWDVNQDRGVG